MKSQYSWRVVDFVTAAVLAIASGFIFLGWNLVYAPVANVVTAFTPGLKGLLLGMWLVGGVLGGLIIRKPGAALFVELFGAIVEMALGSQWGIHAVYAGLLQGLGAELIFLAFAYRKSTLSVACLAGLGSAIGNVVLHVFTSAFLAHTVLYQVVNIASSCVSGIILAGVVSWLLTRALVKAGALDKFPVGRDAVREV